MAHPAPPTTRPVEDRGLNSVRRLRCRFRLAGDGAAAAWAAVDREALVAEAATAGSRLLAEQLAHDASVYVLRRVRLETATFVPRERAEQALVQRLGRGLTAAILHEIARGGEEMVHFASQADYVAHFIRDLLTGGAWECWYYYPFARCRADSLQETLQRVFDENRAHLAAILAALQRDGQLEAVLTLLGLAGSAALWRAIGDDAPSDTEALRPLAAAALALGHRLDLWRGPPPAPDALLQEMTALQPALDWRDRRSLAVALFSALALLVSRDRLQPPATAGRAALDAALQALDWLDWEWLRDRLLELSPASPGAHDATPADLPGRRAAGPTARQRRLLDALNHLVYDGALFAALDRAQPLSAANSLRLYAALVVQYPEWQDDPLARALIDRVLAAWDALQRGSPAEAQPTLQALGQPGQALARRLAQQAAPEAGAARQRCEWASAGAALVLRTVLDARLSALVHQASGDDPDHALRAVLAALLLRLSAAGEIDEGPGLPPALVALCGGFPTTRAELHHALQTVSPATLAAGWLDILAGQRALDPSAMRLLRLAQPGQQPLLIADAAAGLAYPLAGLLPGTEAASAAIVRGWLQQWTAASGVRPTLLVSDPALAAELDVEVVRDADAAARERVQMTWEALAAGRLGLPQHDLLLGLLAAGLLRLWARWLRNFSESSMPYLLAHFIRRPGVVVSGGGELRIELAPRPLDVVLEMAGYFRPLARAPWLDGRLVFEVR